MINSLIKKNFVKKKIVTVTFSTVPPPVLMPQPEVPFRHHLTHCVITKMALTCSRVVGRALLKEHVSLSITRDMSKHYNPKFRWHRSKKVMFPLHLKHDYEKHPLPQYLITGLAPLRGKKELPLTVTTLGVVVEPYVPDEGDGIFSKVPSQALKNLKDVANMKRKNIYHTYKLKSLDKEFDEKQFGILAQDIYIKAHTALTTKNIDEIEKYATDTASEMMLANVTRKTVRWKFIESLDPPRVVQVRLTQGYQKTYFGQVTVKFHTKQMLAIYDRFGRLMYGSEILAKDVFEYVVFEKNVASYNGVWRVHDKIIPDWVTRDQVYRTYAPLKEKTMEEEMDEDFNAPAGTFAKLIEEEAEDAAEVSKQLAQTK